MIETAWAEANPAMLKKADVAGDYRKAMPKTIEQIANEAIILAKSLINSVKNKPSGVNGFPTKAGIYLIYCEDRRKKGIIYVGESDNLKRRLKGHLSAGQSEVTSFRGQLNDDKDLDVKYGQEMRDWVFKNCEFALDDSDMYQSQDVRKLVESLLIAFLRAKGEPLLNK